MNFFLKEMNGSQYGVTMYHVDTDGIIDVIEFNRTKRDEFGGRELVQPPCEIAYNLYGDGKFFAKDKCN